MALPALLLPVASAVGSVLGGVARLLKLLGKWIGYVFVYFAGKRAQRSKDRDIALAMEERWNKEAANAPRSRDELVKRLRKEGKI